MNEPVFFRLGIIILIPFVLILSTLIIIITRSLYKRRINRAIREETSRAHIAIPDPADMLRFVSIGILILLLVVQTISIYRLNSAIVKLNQQMEIVQLTSNNHAVLAALENLKSDLLQAGQREQSNIATFQYELGAIHTDTNKVDVLFQLKLKNVETDARVMMTLPLIGNVAFQRNASGFYEATAVYDLTASIPNYSDDCVASLTVTEGSKTTSEAFSYEMYPFPICIHRDVFVDLSDFSHSYDLSNTGEYLILDELALHFTPESSARWSQIKKVTLSVYEDGVEKRVDDVTDFFSSWAKEIRFSRDAYKLSSKNFHDLRVYLTIETQDGYQLRTNMTYLSDVETKIDYITIIDAKGNRIFAE